MTDWALAGTYLEACNCEAICPCRRIGGQAGGHSTYGTCLGALSWSVKEGHAGAVDLAGLGVIIACRYEDDEPGSPWTYALFVDERGSEDQREALVGIFTGRLGGTPLRQFPWAFKESRFLGWRATPIAIEHTPRRGWFRAGEQLTVRVGDPVAEQEAVTCVIPGHDRSGVELHGELLRVDEGPLAFEVTGRCAYQATFSYSSADA